MKITTGVINGITKITVDGKITMLNAREIKEAVSKSVASGERSVILDCGKVGHIDSSGFGMLIQQKKRLAEAGGGFKLFNVQESVLKIMRQLGPVKHIEVYDSEEEAVAAFVDQ